MDTHKVVILGGGFGGLTAALKLKNAPVQVTLIDRCNYHLFQPLVYQVAAGSFSPANVAGPLRQVVRKQKNTQVLLGEAVNIDTAKRQVILSDGVVDYDTLIVATGSTHQYFGHEEWEEFAPGLKNLNDATAMRGRILLAFEAAERERDPEKLRAWMTFVIVGAGAMVTGIDAEGVTIKEGDRTEKIPTRTVLWAAGVLASPLGKILNQNAGAPLDKASRVLVEPDLTVPGHPEIFVIGDLANFSHQTGQPLPGVAQPAIQEGAYVAKVIRARFRGEKPKPFHYFDKGNLATIGPFAALPD